jgi:hypothetical protein
LGVASFVYALHGRRSSVVGRRSSVVGRRSSVVGRRSPVAALVLSGYVLA